MTPEVNALIADLATPDPAGRLAAIEKLARLGEGAGAAAVTLVSCLSGDGAIREAATGALEDLGPPPVEQLPELAKLASHESGDVAYWAATLIGRLQAAGAPATSALAQALEGSSIEAARERAAWALGEIGPGAKDALAGLQKAAASGSPRLARLAQQAIERINAK